MKQYNITMALSPEQIQAVAVILGTEVQPGPHEILSVCGIDTNGRNVSLTIKPVSRVVEICDVEISDPNNESEHQAALLINGKLTVLPGGEVHILDIKEDLFRVGLSLPAVVIHHHTE